MQSLTCALKLKGEQLGRLQRTKQMSTKKIKRNGEKNDVGNTL